jgi:hypothetical protein
MSKTAGLGDGLVVDGIDLSGDTGSAQAIGASRPTTNVTGIDKSAIERLHLLRDGRLDWSSWFNPAAGAAHEELSTLPTSDRIVTYLAGRTAGDPAACMVAKQLNYDPTRNEDGSLTIALQARANGFGLEWGHELTDGFEVFTGASDGTAVDFDASTDFGLQAYAQVLAITGTQDVDIEITDSANGSDFATIGSGVAFPTFTAVGAARVQTDRDETIRQHLRVEITSTFTTATILVVVKKNRIETLF